MLDFKILGFFSLDTICDFVKKSSWSAKRVQKRKFPLPAVQEIAAGHLIKLALNTSSYF